MSIDAIKNGISGIAPLLQPQKPGEVQAPQGQASFADMFTNAIKEVDKLQDNASNQIEGLILKKDGVTAHGAMIALEKADVAFQLMTQIKSKIIAAYQEVLRTQV